MRILKYFLGAVALVSSFSPSISVASEFYQPWKSSNKALVIDGYEFNEFNLVEIAKNKQVAAFIHKGSDGLPAKYKCGGNSTPFELCKQKWRRYAVGKELYQTRRTLAKSLGLKWGAYHLARPGNPLDQARHFIDYTNPSDDEVIVLDIEDINSKKWMSLKDAETFSNYIYKRLGRWPMLYTNGSTAQFIAQNRDKYQILSRLPLWYARYKPNIKSYFPKGNWDTYDIWQFQSQINCNARRCPYPLKGANRDIDINVVNMSVDELKAAWPFDQLRKEEAPKVLPVPMARPAIDNNADIMLASTSGTASFKIAKPLNLEITVNATPSLTAISEGYSQAALARGAKLPKAEIDPTATATIKKARINDLF